MSNKTEAGLSLVETLVALLIFLAVLAGVVPVYLNYQLKALQNPVRTGAVAVSQKVLDEIRQVSDVATLPTGGTIEDRTPQGTSLDNLSAYDKSYSAKIIYCEAAYASLCDNKSRHVHVRVYQKFGNGTTSTQPVYEVSTLYTKFDQ
jgi:Tfp pilus assembly protein PilV